MADRLEYDFVCVGAGIGGLTAAVAAHEFGLSVLVVEKSNKLGGVGAISGGQCWVPANHLEARAGIDDSVEDGLAYLLWAGGGLADETLARHYCERARDAVEFLEQHAGVSWSIVPLPDPLHGYPEAQGSVEVGRLLEADLFPGDELQSLREMTRKTRYRDILTANERYSTRPEAETIAERRRRDDRTMGGSLLAPLVRSAADRGIDIWTEAVVERLVTDQRRVTGLDVMVDGASRSVGARHGVVLATGGYDASDEFLQMYEACQQPSSVSLPSVTGDHFRLAGMVGAKVASPFRMRHTFIEPAVAVVYDEDGVATRVEGIVKPGYPHMITVDRYGHRFYNESSAPSRDSALLAIDPARPWQLVSGMFWAIWDHRHALSYSLPEERTIPGVVVEQTIEGLADAIGIPARNLLDEIERFNGFVDAGIDEDFGRGSNPSQRAYGDYQNPDSANLGKLDEPPFYAVRLVPRALGIVSAGLVTNSSSQVIDWEDSPIEGLYAAGNSVAMIELGLGYTGGNANARGLLHGYCAAEHAGSTGR